MKTCTVCGTEFPDHEAVCVSCGMAPAAPTLALPSGSVLKGGQFVVDSVLGRGGFGLTYQGIQQSLHRPVAIKELFPDGSVRQGTTVMVPDDRQSEFHQGRGRILEEARLIASLQSNHVVDVYDAFLENGTAYIVMEFLDGRSLLDKIDEVGKLPLDEVTAIALDACEGLEAVHTNHLLHRDIKPDNIMLTADNRAVLIDFGSAREFAFNRTALHTRILTEAYASPEQYSAQARFGPYTDIFCLGATLFHALTGNPPPAALERLQPPEPAIVFPSNLQGPLCSAIRSALAIRVQDRPQTIGDFKAAIAGTVLPAAPVQSPATTRQSTGSRLLQAAIVGNLEQRGAQQQIKQSERNLRRAEETLQQRPRGRRAKKAARQIAEAETALQNSTGRRATRKATKQLERAERKLDRTAYGKKVKTAQLDRSQAQREIEVASASVGRGVAKSVGGGCMMLPVLLMAVAMGISGALLFA